MAAFTGARNQIKLLSPTSQTMAVKYLVPSGAVMSIVRGCPLETVDATGTTTGGVRIGTTQKPTSASNYHFAGLAKSDSTETAAAAGIVYGWLPFPGLIYSGKSLVAASTNTAAKLLAMMYQRVYFDLSTMVWTIDTAATDAAANGLVIVGGDYQTSTVWVAVSSSATIFTCAA